MLTQVKSDIIKCYIYKTIRTLYAYNYIPWFKIYLMEIVSVLTLYQYYYKHYVRIHLRV